MKKAMGGIFSREFEELVEECTPGSPMTDQKVMKLNVDPRSPGITRTPILVERTPEMIKDPRSPTAGIIRTPLMGSSETSNSTISEISDMDISSNSLDCSLSAINSNTVQEYLYTLPPLDLEDDENYVHKQSDLKETKIEVSKAGPAESPTLRKRNAEKESSENVSNLVLNCKTKSATFQVHSDNNEQKKEFQRHVLCIATDGHQRSPLSKRNIDMNSPLHIVQRKQSNKLGMLKSTVKKSLPKSATNSPCQLDALPCEDKENMSM